MQKPLTKRNEQATGITICASVKNNSIFFDKMQTTPVEIVI